MFLAQLHGSHPEYRSDQLADRSESRMDTELRLLQWWELCVDRRRSQSKTADPWCIHCVHCPAVRMRKHSSRLAIRADSGVMSVSPYIPANHAVGLQTAKPRITRQARGSAADRL